METEIVQESCNLASWLIPILTASIGALIGTFGGAWFLYRRQEDKIENVRLIAIKALKIFLEYAKQKKSFVEASSEFNTKINVSEKRAIVVALHKLGVPFEPPTNDILNIKRLNFKDVVISIKASNTVVMVRSMRLLCAVMSKEKMTFPLHLGVTEAGEGEDGRIKSAAGIGALLADGIGDTLRVSLSEAPECEIPVAYKLASYVIEQRNNHQPITARACGVFDWIHPERRATIPVKNIGGTNLPVVISCRLGGEEDYGTVVPDYVYCGGALPKKRMEGVGYILDLPVWKGEEGTYPAFTPTSLPFVGGCRADLKFLFLTYTGCNAEVKAFLRQHPEVVIVAQSNHANRLGEQRALIHELWSEGLNHPVIAFQHYALTAPQMEDFQIRTAADCGALLFDNLIDGICLFNNPPQGRPNIPLQRQDDTAFGILQATRQRTTKTEYISCPGCGRTLYDLQATIARIKAATAHLKGLKIAIMGCIVNGPGEMADADWGYVGEGNGKVSIYKGKEPILRHVPESEAIDKLLELIENR